MLVIFIPCLLLFLQGRRTSIPDFKETEFVYDGAKTNDTLNVGDLVMLNNDVVRTPDVAVRLALSIAIDVYGEDVLDEKPFHVNLLNDSVWQVHGTLHSDFGGSVHIGISKQNGSLMYIYHEK